MGEKIKSLNKEKEVQGYVYYFYIPSVFSYDKIYPPLRQQEIERVSNEEVRKEKYFVWKLLEHVLYDRYKRKIDSFKFTKDNRGRWNCEGVNISLSHRKGYVVVAISDDLIGVDVEQIRVPVENFENKILTQSEMTEYKTVFLKDKEKYLIRKWSEKESIYKMDNSIGVSFRNVDTNKFTLTHKFIDNDSFVITVSTKKQINLQFIDVKNLIG